MSLPSAPRSYGDGMSFTQITYEVDGPAAIITLNRPEQLNAFTGTMLEELLVAFDQADADDAVRAVIMTGAGRVYCAGADLSSGGDTFNADARGRTSETPRAPRDGGGVLVLRIFDCTKPVIGAINGSAVGVGISMTLPMDIRILADNAKVGFVFTGRGIAPDGAASWFLPRVVGINQALEWVLTARVFRAQEALDGGLVRSIHPANEVLDVAKALAAEIATNAAPGLGDGQPRPAVADARRGPPDGRPPRRLRGHLRPRPQARLPRGRDGLPREARAGLDPQPHQGPPADATRTGTIRPTKATDGRSR